MLYAPTRSGKGVGIVIPNCIWYEGCMVILDIKLENYLATAGYRQAALKTGTFISSARMAMYVRLMGSMP